MSITTQLLDQMLNSKHIFITLLALALAGCSSKYGDLPLKKRYWTPEDYDLVVFELRFPDNKDDKLPTFDDPESSLIVEKLTDPQNYLVVLDDDELGLKYKNEVAEKFFAQWKDMNQIYWHTDRQDKYIYGVELVECWKFGLGLQLKYFKLGNDLVQENSIDPESSRTRSTVSGNIQTMIGNFNIYLDLVKNENSLSEDALSAYARGLDEYFGTLIGEYPNANYSGTKKKIELLLKKSESEDVISSLNNVLAMIDSKSQNES